jgi:hypothetical protein
MILKMLEGKMGKSTLLLVLIPLVIGIGEIRAEAVIKMPLGSRGPDDYEYLIVTSDPLKNSFGTFIEFNKRRCLRTKVETIQFIESNTSGIDDQDKLRNYIKDQYQNHNIVFVLLAGDINTIPFRELYTECYDHHQTPDRFLQKYSMADMYYSCLDGNWNNDSDNKFGEPGEEDLSYEVYVSRLPADNATELNYCINKIIKYSEQPVTDQVTSNLLSGCFLWDDYGITVWGADHCEQYVGVCNDSGYTTKGFPTSGWTTTRLYDKTSGSANSWTANDFISSVNTNKPAWINYVGHGNTTYSFGQSASYVTNGNYQNNGTNANYYLMYAVSCNSAMFKVNDCILEQFLTIQNGAVACVGFSENIMLDDDGLDGPAQRIARYFHDAVFNKGIHYLEMMNAYSKEMNTDIAANPNAINIAPYYGAIRFMIYEINVLGDPALSIWTATPGPLEPDYDTVLSTLAFSMQTVPYSWVALVDVNGDIISSKMSDENGNCVIDDQALADYVTINPQITIKVRIKAHNYLPFEGKLIINRINFIKVQSPAGGEVLGKGKQYDITWNDDIDDNVKIELLKGGALHSVIADPLPSTSPYSWMIHDTITSGSDYRILITSLDRPYITDESAGNFTITSPIITVSSPNGGETLYVGSEVTITWSSVGMPENVNINYSTNGGSNWNTGISNTENDGTHQWTVPDAPSATCKIQIIGAIDDIPVDVSDNVFTISPPVIELSSPNGGEAWYIGKSYNITWSTMGFVGDVKIEYSRDNGTNWSDIITATANDGSHPWIIPDESSTTCKIRISEASDGNPIDESDGVFIIEIEPSVALSFPVGGEVLYIDTTYTVRWSTIGRVDDVKIEYSSDNGATWSVITSQTENDGLYDWQVPDIQEGTYKVRISEASDGVPFKISDDIYIEYAPSITVSYPNGGEIFYIGMVYKIMWVNKGTVGDIKIDYSNDNGVNWNIVVSRVTNNGSYNWKIPDDESQNCIIRISEASNDDIIDLSDNTFSIAPPFIQVSVPNGGEIWGAGYSHDITWSGEGFLGDVKIEYSTDNGSSWKEIIENAGNNGVYSWIVPNDTSSSCKVRVSESENASPVDESDAAFKIESGTAIQNTKPNVFQGSFDITPNPVDIHTTREVSFYITSQEEIKETIVKVYDAVGNELFVLNENRQLAPNKQHLLGTWDLRAKTGKLISDGLYIAILKIKNNAGEICIVKRMVGVKKK